MPAKARRGSNVPPTSSVMAPQLQAGTSASDGATAAGNPTPVRPTRRQLTTVHDRPRRQSRLAWLLVGGGAAVIVAAVVVIALATRNSAPTPPATLPEVYQVPGSRDHVAEGTKVTYPNNPPSSGPHYPSPAPWGNYPQALPPERWVHNLEHGGIVVLYSCPTSCDQLKQQLAQQLLPRIPNDPSFHEQKIIITPYAGLDHLLRVQAWGWTMPLDSVNTAEILAFYDEHVDKGPEQIP